MNRWQKKLNDHPIWQTIEEINRYLAPEVISDDGRLDSEKNRLRDVVTQIAHVSQSIDPEFVPLKTLDILNSKLIEDVLSLTEQYSTSNDIKFLVDANDQATNLLGNFGILKSLGDRTKQQIKSEFSSQINQFIDQQSNVFSQQVNEHSKNVKSKSESVIGEMNNILSDGHDKREKILELYAIVAGDSATSGYARDALEEGKRANIWRIWSILFIISTAGWLVTFILGIIYIAHCQQGRLGHNLGT